MGLFEFLDNGDGEITFLCSDKLQLEEIAGRFTRNQVGRQSEAVPLCLVRLMEFLDGATRLRGGAKALDVWRIETKAFCSKKLEWIKISDFRKIVL